MDDSISVSFLLCIFRGMPCRLNRDEKGISPLYCISLVFRDDKFGRQIRQRNQERCLAFRLGIVEVHLACLAVGADSHSDGPIGAFEVERFGESGGGRLADRTFTKTVLDAVSCLHERSFGGW